MDAHSLEAKETIPASRKLGRDDAAQLLTKASRLFVAKGKKVREFNIKGKPSDDAVDAMLGPTGNLRAPTIRVGKTILVGFEDTMFEAVFG